VWEADGVVSEQWAPVSPVTGRLDAFEWREPPERLGQVIEPDLLEPPVLNKPNETPSAIDAKVVEIGTTAKDGEAEPEGTAKSIPSEGVASAPGDGKVRAKTPPVGTENTGKVDAAPVDRRSHRSSADREEEREARIPPPPDDPGVKDAEEEDGTAPGRFRLF
jgi:HemY protein